MKMKKIVATGSALALTAAVAVGGTLAYLTANTEVKVNKFTYEFGTDQAPIDLTLEEPSWVPGSPVTPGATIDKDPTLTVGQGSVKSHVYAEVVSTFPENTVSYEVSDAWTEVSDNIYRYVGTKLSEGVVDASAAAVELEPLFTEVKVANLSNEQMAALVNPDSETNELLYDITIQGYAIQSDDLEDGTTTADAEAIAWFTEN